jgi:hypothetical protein
LPTSGMISMAEPVTKNGMYFIFQFCFWRKRSQSALLYFSPWRKIRVMN